MASNNLPNCSYCYSGRRGSARGLEEMLNLAPLPSLEEAMSRTQQPVLHNGSSMMIGGAGDPAGILDIGA